MPIFANQLYMLERQRRKKQRLGQPKVQTVLAATLAFHDIPNFRFTDCHGTATSSSAVDSQHLQKIQGWKMPKPRFSWQRQSSFPKVLRRTSPKIQAGPFDVMLKLLGWLRLDDPAEKMQTNYKWRIWLEKHWGIFCTQKNRTSCAPVCPLGLQSFAPVLWNHRS